MDIDEIFQKGIDVKTERDLSKNEKKLLIKDQKEEVKELFNINPFHRYHLGMANYFSIANSESWEEYPTIKDIDPKDYVSYEYKIIKKGPFTIKKKINLFVSPKFKNNIQPKWSLIKMLNEECPPTWREPFKLSYKELNYLNDIIKGVEDSGKTLCPQKQDLFKAFELCPLNNVKVVIIGQDPYHTVKNGVPVANGLCFSTYKGFSLQPSLKNIYDEIKRNYPSFKIPKHGDLTSWASQGVLLINSTLTVTEGAPNCHSVFWRGFTTNILKVLNKVKPKCIYMLWGKFAQKMKPFIHDNDCILETSHPSGFSVYRGFKGCGHFLKCNELLRSMDKKEILWDIE